MSSAAMASSGRGLTEVELRNWILSLPPDSVKSLEEALKSIREQHCKEEDDEPKLNLVSNEELFADNSQKTIDSPEIVGNSINDKHIQSMDMSTIEYKMKSEPTDDTIDISPPSRTVSPSSSYVSGQSRNKFGKTYENGRRNLKDENVSEEEAHRRAKRRERNRLAAAKCRKRRQDKIETLQQRVDRLKSDVGNLTDSLLRQNTEQIDLDCRLEHHKCVMQTGHTKAVSTNGTSRRRPSSLPLAPAIATTRNNDNQDVVTVPDNYGNSSFVICSLSPQLVSLSPLLTPSTMKLLLETLANGSANNIISSSSSSEPLSQQQPQQQQMIQSSTVAPITSSTPSSATCTSSSASSSVFSRSLSLLNLLTSPSSTDLLNLSFLAASGVASPTTLSNASPSTARSSLVPSIAGARSQNHHPH